jgi:hypothetical protein
VFHQEAIDGLEISEVGIATELGHDTTLLGAEDVMEVADTEAKVFEGDVALDCAVDQAVNKIVLVEDLDLTDDALLHQPPEVPLDLLVHALTDLQQQADLVEGLVFLEEPLYEAGGLGHLVLSGPEVHRGRPDLQLLYGEFGEFEVLGVQKWLAELEQWQD